MSTLAELKTVSMRRMAGVHPKLQSAALRVIEDLYNKEGLRFAVHMGKRTFAMQKALYMQGRQSLGVVNAARKAVGLGPLSSAANKGRVTSVTTSWHNFGMAVDLVEDASQASGIRWSWKRIKSFLKIGKYAKKHGLQWGGYWRSFKDYPHMQLPSRLRLSAARAVYTKHGIDYLWKHY